MLFNFLANKTTSKPPFSYLGLLAIQSGNSSAPGVRSGLTIITILVSTFFYLVRNCATNSVCRFISAMTLLENGVSDNCVMPQSRGGAMAPVNVHARDYFGAPQHPRVLLRRCGLSSKCCSREIAKPLHHGSRRKMIKFTSSLSVDGIELCFRPF